MVVESWLYGTISPKLQDVTRQHAHTAHAAWLALENRFIAIGRLTPSTSMPPSGTGTQ
jgi:hypothetical protein